MTHPPASTPTPSEARAPRAKIHHGLTVRDVHVTAVGRVAPRMVRVTLGGAELDGLVSLGPTDHVKVFFPDPGTGLLTAPEAAPAGTMRPPVGGTVHRRDYTVRAYRPDGITGPELDLDLVLHGDGGPASAWAVRATEGDRLVLAGPKSSKLVPHDVTTVLLGCDETSLPAVARWLELLPEQVAVRVIAEVDSAEDEVYLREDRVAARPGLEIIWLHRRGRPDLRGLLEAAVRDSPAADLVWCAGEAASLVGVRRFLRRELGLPAAHVELTGYWRRGVANFDHHTPLDPKDPD